jgi:hypothetical protein
LYDEGEDGELTMGAWAGGGDASRETVRRQEEALQGLLRRAGGSLVVHGSRASTTPKWSCTSEPDGDDLPVRS